MIYYQINADEILTRFANREKFSYNKIAFTKYCWNKCHRMPSLRDIMSKTLLRRLSSCETTKNCYIM